MIIMKVDYIFAPFLLHFLLCKIELKISFSIYFLRQQQQQQQQQIQN